MFTIPLTTFSPTRSEEKLHFVGSMGSPYGALCGKGVGQVERLVYALVICSLVVFCFVKDKEGLHGALETAGIRWEGLAKQLNASDGLKIADAPPLVCAIPPFLWPDIERAVILPADFACPTRDMLGDQLERRGAAVGAEIGVQRGHFTSAVLGGWHSAQKMYLIDIWRQLPNYVDKANVDDASQDALYLETQQNLAAWSNITVYLRMFSNDAAKQIPDGELDYCYLDARHDYCSVMEDLVTWYPKVKSGGFFSGHDFIFDSNPAIAASGQDWGICPDGVRHPGGPRGAVLEFAARNGLKIMECDSNTWFIYKP
eukprot:TRINITY_DN374_c0_g3_i1.p1 TRINITY_DN374_c0_g3~~TRINITY_DN374_c0_g3_i1.p1  ORF type:complete len:314 (-),score=27.75 TRINITY_DN374_c0_g3_i1:208-1149(-)